MVLGSLPAVVPAQVVVVKVIVGVGDENEEIDLGMDGEAGSCWDGGGVVVMVPDGRTQQEVVVPAPTQLVPWKGCE